MKYLLLSIATFFILGLTPLSASENNSVSSAAQNEYHSQSIGKLFVNFYESTGINALLSPVVGLTSHGKELSAFTQSGGRIIMILVAFLLFYLAIAKDLSRCCLFLWDLVGF